MSKHFLSIFIFAAFIQLLSACQTNPSLDGFSAEQWRSDPRGCQGKRAAFMDTLYAQRDKIKGLGREHIRRLFGKPDFQKLYRRDQRFFIYFYAPGPQCKDSVDIEKGKLLKLRFNSVGLVSETIFLE